MTAAEKQELEKLRQEKEKRRKQAKQWNENAKKKWETVSCRLPAGTKARIDSTGESINGMINRLILAELERWERSADQEPTAADQETSAETSADQEREPEPAADHEPKQETAEPAPKQEEQKPQAGIYNPPTYDETEAERIQRERAEIDLYSRFNN